MNGSYEQIVNFDVGYRPVDLKGTWAHLVVNFNYETKQISFYVNGVKQSNTLNFTYLTGSTSNTSPLLIGSMYGWKTDGMVDEVRIYNRILEEPEILQLANQ